MGGGAQGEVMPDCLQRLLKLNMRALPGVRPHMLHSHCWGPLLSPCSFPASSTSQTAQTVQLTHCLGLHPLHPSPLQVYPANKHDAGLLIEVLKPIRCAQWAARFVHCLCLHRKQEPITAHTHHSTALLQ